MFVDPTKAKLLNEGRNVGSKFFNYGGFPRVIKENEAATEKFEDNPLDPKDATQQNVAVSTDEDELTAIEKRMAELENRISDSAHNMGLSERSWKQTGIGKKINSELLDLQMKRDYILNPDQTR
jgi:hypothetical protein